MKNIIGSKMMSVMIFGIISVLFTANPAQAFVNCCCCAPPTCTFMQGSSCPSGCKDILGCNDDPQGNCDLWCFGQIDRPDEEEIIESFMPDEYVNEVIAMDEECSNEADETADVSDED